MEWTTEWPTKTGMYWFYGERFRNQGEKRLYTLNVMQGANSLVYICEGVFLYKGEGANGRFLPLPTPELPSDS